MQQVWSGCLMIACAGGTPEMLGRPPDREADYLPPNVAGVRNGQMHDAFSEIGMFSCRSEGLTHC
jgi:hypothetical protein